MDVLDQAPVRHRRLVHVQRAGERAGDWIVRRDPVRWILGAMVVTWALVFIVLGWLRQSHYQTFSFDLGIYDQAVWLLSRFREPFDTVKGLNIFGHHMNLILVLLAPFYWLGFGPEFLLVVQVAAQASGAIAIFLLARDRLADRWLALALAGVLLLNPTYQFLTWEYFHPDAVAIAPLLFAYWAARAGRWRWFAVAAVLALACKEDVAPAVAVLGVLIYFRGERRVGAAVAALSAGWFLLATRVLMPAALGGLNPFYDSYFGDFGTNAGQVVRNIAGHPAKAIKVATRPDRINYYRMMLLPVAFLPFASLSTLAIALPMVAINALTSFPYARDIRYHYSALVVAGIMLATVEGVARLGRSPGVRRFLVGLLVATSLATTVAWGPSPISTKYHSGLWPLGADARLAAKKAAAAVIPSGEAVAATYYFIPHLAHRAKIYDFPEPWKAVNWGIHGEGLHDPGGVRWLILDRQLFNDYDQTLVARIIGTEFAVRFDRDGIVVAERVRPGGRLPLG